jgi:NAD(P)-dependent dehydrogenase (short-subunit alcohol dehydrogenase family)
MVMGASRTERNIGAVVQEQLQDEGWTVDGSDCLDTDGVYRIPSTDLKQYDAMVVTLGHTRMVPFSEASEDDIHEVIRGSLILPLMAARGYVRDRNSRGGTVVLVGSYAHDHPLTHCAAYCAAKAGLAAAVKELAWEMTPLFFFHIVHPYHVPATPMGQRVVEGLMESRDLTMIQAEAYQRKDLRMPEHLTAGEVAEVVSWLLSDPVARWTAGSGINLYGGSR